MGKVTNISWTDSTLNLAWGCTKVTAECTNCYMFRDSKRFGRDPSVVTILKAGKDPKLLDQKIKESGKHIFVNSMSDTFHRAISTETLDMWFTAFARNQQHIFQILTKRPARMLNYLMQDHLVGIAQDLPDNIWIGTSVGIRKTVPRIDILKRIPAAVRFVSFEPLLEDLGEIDLKGIQWGLIGGESDHHDPRPMDPAWAEHLITQMRRDGVAPWFKQMGGKGGDGSGGDLLNGRKIQEWPGRS